MSDLLLLGLKTERKNKQLKRLRDFRKILLLKIEEKEEKDAEKLLKQL